MFIIPNSTVSTKSRVRDAQGIWATLGGGIGIGLVIGLAKDRVRGTDWFGLGVELEVFSRTG